MYQVLLRSQICTDSLIFAYKESNIINTNPLTIFAVSEGILIVINFSSYAFIQHAFIIKSCYPIFFQTLIDKQIQNDVDNSISFESNLSNSEYYDKI